MRFGRELGGLYLALPASAQAAIVDAYAERRKSVVAAYLAWICLGSHYLYLRRPFVQLAFWLTLGGLLMWWLRDGWRLGGAIRRRNERAAQEVMAEFQIRMAQALWRTPEPDEPAVIAEPQPAPVEPVPVALALEPKRRPRGAAFVAFAGIATAFVLCVIFPPPVYPAAEKGEKFRAVRDVNVRAMPTTASAIMMRASEGRLLRGSVQTGKDGGRWLRIERGPGTGGYVFAQNLEPQT